MRNLGRLRGLPSRRNERLYWIGYAVLTLLVLGVACITVIILENGYKEALDNCMKNGNSKTYCEVMLN